MALQRLLWYETLADYVSKVYTTQYLCIPQLRHPQAEKSQSLLCEERLTLRLNERPRPKAGKLPSGRIAREVLVPQ